MQRGNALGHVCLSVCLAFEVLTFESLDLETFIFGVQLHFGVQLFYRHTTIVPVFVPDILHM